MCVRIGWEGESLENSYSRLGRSNPDRKKTCTKVAKPAKALARKILEIERSPMWDGG